MKTLTQRDDEILAILVRRVRCLSAEQIAEHWWPDGRGAAAVVRRRLRELQCDGWLLVEEVFARPRPALSDPILRWQPGAPTPDFGPISYHLKQRFAEAAVRTWVVSATRQAGKRFGLPAGRRVRRTEATHDLGLSDVYLLLRRTAPRRAVAWVAEAQLGKQRQGMPVKLPDALLRLGKGQEVVIEFGGEYGKRRLLTFHEDCEECERGYELW